MAFFRRSIFMQIMVLVQSSVIAAVLAVSLLAYYGITVVTDQMYQSSATSIAYTLSEAAASDLQRGAEQAPTFLRIATNLKRDSDGSMDIIVLQKLDGTVVSSTDTRQIGNPLTDDVAVKALTAGEGKPVWQKADGRFDASAVVMNGSKPWGVVRIMGSAAQLQKQVLMQGLPIAAAALLVVAFAGFLTRIRARRFVQPIVSLSDQASKLAAGDLTVQVDVKGEDEVARLAREFNDMAGKVRELLSGIKQAGGQVYESSELLSQGAAQTMRAIEHFTESAASIHEQAERQAEDTSRANSVVVELARAVTDIAHGAEEQAGGMTQINQMTAKMMGLVQSIHQEIEEVSAAAGGALQAAGTGQSAMTASSQGMNRINQAVQVIARQMEELRSSTERIHEVISLIGEVAEQTNMLALNAAIEAARAGEAGKGFAVVADEVRRLASRTQGAASEVTKLVQAIQGGAREVLSAVERGNAEVQEGTGLTQRATEAFSQIVRSVQETEQRTTAILRDASTLAESSGQVQEAIGSVAAVAEENSAAAEEMSAGSDQVKGLIDHVEGISRKTSSMVAEMARDTVQLSIQADGIAETSSGLMESARRLQEMVRRFKV
ncbi:MAG TPA: HAMP domain-containing methyl-accepting chemotaxis protein [Symbiobacteriaceae bacterium]|nr:HAMP domain-containing methyl-accepting chemotaxis protein [Symbiobacteriaceae bacterium]